MKKYVPRAIQNIFDRIEAYNESITEKLFSEPLPKTFEVVIYTDLNPQTKSQATNKNDPESVTNYNFYNARSQVGHHDHLVSPESARNIDEYNRLRNSHFQAILKKKSDDQSPVLGDVWLATQSGGNVVTLVSFQRNIPIRLNLDNQKGTKNSFKNSSSSTKLLANYDSSETSVPTPESTPTSELSFVSKIKNSPSFSGWSAQALAGVIANAKADSAYENLAAGDSITFYQSGFEKGKVSERRMNNVLSRNVNGKCSWGYWQLNICPDNGAGKQLVDEQGIDITTRSGKEEWIKKLQDDEFQFAFVARQIASVININTNDAYQAGYDITVKFERPANATEKGVGRGNSAKEIYEKYKDKLSS